MSSAIQATSLSKTYPAGKAHPHATVRRAEAATLLLAASAFSAMGAFASVAVRQIFEAQTLANFIRFPMMFLGGVFVPVASLPIGLQIVARLLPLTYAVESFQAALHGGPWALIGMDLAALAAFTLVLFALAARIMARRLA